MLNVTQMPPATEPPAFTEDPIPLTLKAVAAKFPVSDFPAPIAAMISAVAEATQTDPAMAGTSALTVLAAAAGGRVEVKVRSGWTEPLCLYCATVAGPGERKSAVQHEMASPIYAVEEELASAGVAVRLEAETLHAIAVKNAERARAAASSAEGPAKDQASADAVSAAAFAEAIAVPAVPRIVADDVTPEAAATLLTEQGGRLAIISAEGGIFDIIAGRYSNIPSMDLWLKGHSGDQIRVDRKGRDPEYIKRPALTLGLMLQPSVLASVGSNKTFRGRGLLARFLYAIPQSYVGRRKANAAPVPDEVRETYDELIGGLARDLNGWTDPMPLVFAPEAAADIVRIEEDIEPTLAEDGELGALADWGSKYLGAIMRIAGLLHVAQHGSDAHRTPIGRETVLSALRIGKYYKAAAIRAFGEMQIDQGTADAVHLLERLKKVSGDTVSERDLHYLSQSRFKTKADFVVPFMRLVDNGYLAPLPEAEHSTGRKPSPRYAIHPIVRAS